MVQRVHFYPLDLALISYNSSLPLTEVFETSQVKCSVFLRANLENKNVLFVL